VTDRRGDEHYCGYKALHNNKSATMHIALQTDGETDRRHYDANSQSYCVTARSAMKSVCKDAVQRATLNNMTGILDK